MGAIASQITSLTIVYSTVYSDPDQRKYQSSASLALVREIHRRPVNSPQKWPVTRKMFPFDDVIMWYNIFQVTIIFFMFLYGYIDIDILMFNENKIAILTLVNIVSCRTKELYLQKFNQEISMFSFGYISNSLSVTISSFEGIDDKIHKH